LACEVHIDFEDFHRRKFVDTWWLDLLVCQFNANPTESILVGTDFDCVRSAGTLFVHFQENEIEAQS
jgi:hypothetical protein